MDKQQQYLQLVTQNHPNDENLEKIEHYYLRVQNMMSQRHLSFKKMTAKEQFDYAESIIAIALHTTNKQLRKLSLQRNKDEVFKFSIDEFFIKS